MHATLPTLHILTSRGRETILARTLASIRNSDWPTAPIIHTDHGRADTESNIRLAIAWREMLAKAVANSSFLADSRPVRTAASAARAALAATSPWRASSDAEREAAEDGYASRSRQTGKSITDRTGRIGLCGEDESAPLSSFPAAQDASILIIADDVRFHTSIATRLSEWPPFSRGCIRTFASLYHSGGLRDLVGSRGPTWYAASASTWHGSDALLIAPAFAAHCLDRWARYPGITHDRRLATIAARDVPTAPVWVHVPSLVDKADEYSDLQTTRTSERPISVAS